jgi:hypothetical protein
MIKSCYYFLVCCLCILLVGCQSSKPVGVGTVLQYKQVQQSDLPSHPRTKTGAKAGAAVGAGAGLALGSAIATIFAPVALPILATSALVGAGMGAGSGATAGFVADQLAKGKPVYEYHVKLAETGDVIFVYESAPVPYPLGANVIIRQQKDRFVIKDVVRTA